MNLGGRHQNDLIRKTRLFSEDWQSSLPNCVSDFQRLAGFSGYFDASSKHKSDSLLVYSNLACSYPSKILLMHSLLLRQGRKPKHGVPFLRCRNRAYDVAFLTIGGPAFRNVSPRASPQKS